MSSSEGTKESFFKLLKAVCKSCKKASLKTYHQNIKRLYRLIKPEATHVPTTKSCEWLPNRKEVKPLKAKDINLSRDDFRKRDKRNNRSSMKDNFNPIEANIKPLELVNIAAALENVIADSTLFTGVPKPEIDFVREVITQKPAKPDVISIYDIILKSDSISSFRNNISKHMTKENIILIESLTHGGQQRMLVFF